MNFHDFQHWREQALRADPDLRDAGETNVYRALAAWQPPNITEGARTLHRCDLARKWLDRYGYASTLSRSALVCGGVRHALELIFQQLATDGDTGVWLPQDVYPAYGELARAVGLVPRTYATLPSPDLPAVPPRTGSEYLLIANPWKPLGRYVSEGEYAHLVNWLEASPSRYVLIDGVYDFAAPFHDVTQRLYATGRAVLLHSVTKGWLWPKTFGIALMGECGPRLERVFRDHSPGTASLLLADRLLSKEVNLPMQIAGELDRRADRWRETLPAAVCEAMLGSGWETPGRYFFPIDMPAMQLMQRHRILGIPASVFGARDWDGSILSSLSSRSAGIET
jgi:aspartate/methionine/tyrosine aminotransferase